MFRLNTASLEVIHEAVRDLTSPNVYLFEMHMKIRNVIAVAGVAMSVVPLAMGQGLKKCVAADGKVIYSDQACVTGSTSSTVSLPTVAPPILSPTATVAKNTWQTISACEAGSKAACSEKESRERRCKEDRKQGRLSSDCKAYETERDEFLHLQHECKTRNRESACSALSCANGDKGSCERWLVVRDREKNAGQNQLAMQREIARAKALPVGDGWFMSQDWRDDGNGRQNAIVTCNAHTSVALVRSRYMTNRVYIGYNGKEFFLTAEEAAKKACSSLP